MNHINVLLIQKDGGSNTTERLAKMCVNKINNKITYGFIILSSTSTFSPFRGTIRLVLNCYSFTEDIIITLFTLA